MRESVYVGLATNKVCADTWDSVAGLNRGKAAIEFAAPDLASKAVKHMDGGQLDGAFLTVQVSLPIPALITVSSQY